jgi:endonuclease YncB( thermonuclease family)
VRRRVFFSVLALAVGAVVFVMAAVAGSRGAVSARVTAVGAGDTLQVRLSSGKRQTVHVLGVSSPPKKSCFSAEATAATRALVLSRTVKLSAAGPAAYVRLPDGTDLGAQLVTDGSAQIDALGTPFSRLRTYVPLQQTAEKANKGLWGACAVDLSVELVATTTAVAVGGDVKYTATITNAGPLAAQNVDLDVRAPQGNPFDTAASETGHSGCTPHGWYATCAFDSIPAGGTASAFFTVAAKQEGRVAATALVRISGCLSKACGNLPLHDSDFDNDRSGALTSIVPPPPPGQPIVSAQLPVAHWIAGGNCDPHYPTVCMPPSPPDLDCADLSFRGFQVLHDPTPKTPDPHSFDNNFDGVGCQFDDY